MSGGKSRYLQWTAPITLQDETNTPIKQAAVWQRRLAHLPPLLTFPRVCRTRPTPPSSRTPRRASCGSTPTTSTGEVIRSTGEVIRSTGEVATSTGEGLEGTDARRPALLLLLPQLWGCSCRGRGCCLGLPGQLASRPFACNACSALLPPPELSLLRVLQLLNPSLLQALCCRNCGLPPQT